MGISRKHLLHSFTYPLFCPIGLGNEYLYSYPFWVHVSAYSLTYIHPCITLFLSQRFHKEKELDGRSELSTHFWKQSTHHYISPTFFTKHKTSNKSVSLLWLCFANRPIFYIFEVCIQTDNKVWQENLLLFCYTLNDRPCSWICGSLLVLNKK